jgi:hypothetical protein
MNYREYLGDGLYADFDGYHIMLASNNGIQDTNVVYLEPEVLKSFYQYAEMIEQLKKAHQEKMNKIGE